MRQPNFYTALYAVTQSVCDGDIDEAEVTFDHAWGEWAQTLTVRVSRFDMADVAEEETVE